MALSCATHLSVAPLGIALVLATKTVLFAAVGHVIHISVDGLRGDYLGERVANEPDSYPSFRRFVDEGATTFNARTDYFDTTTLANHTSMITGRPVLRPINAPATVHHGYLDEGEPVPAETLHNAGNPNLTYIASTFDVAHDNGLSTAFFASKSKFKIFDQSFSDMTGAEDMTGPDNGRDKIDAFEAHPIAYLTFPVELKTHHFAYSFLHYTFPDGAGHNAGWGSPLWDANVQYVDSEIGKIMTLVETHPALMNDTVLILTADHGGSGSGHGTASSMGNYTIPVMVWGTGVAPGVDLYTLNADSRTDPGTGRPSYTDANQPIRNGDTGNLALQLLGLGPVPGSTMNANQDLRVASPFSADFNGDLAVDESDLTVWHVQYGASAIAPTVRGDADGDRDVDGRDFLAWQRQYGSTLAVHEFIVVPEPAAAKLTVAGWLLYVAACRTLSSRSRSSNVL